MRHLPSVCFLGIFLAAMADAQDFQLKSPDIQNNKTLDSAQVYHGLGCNGGNRSPKLEWSGAPSNTKSFAVTMYDPDAPNGKGWWHWIVFDIPASVTRLDSGAGQKETLPDGARLGRNDFGGMGFGGACPPKGDKPHHYVVAVHALNIDKLPVPSNASTSSVIAEVKLHELGQATLTGMYGR